MVNSQLAASSTSPTPPTSTTPSTSTTVRFQMTQLGFYPCMLIQQFRVMNSLPVLPYRAKLKSNLFSHFRKDRLLCNAKSWTLIWEKCWAGESFDNLSTLQFCSFQKIFKEVRGGDNLRSWKEEMEQKRKLQCTG